MEFYEFDDLERERDRARERKAIIDLLHNQCSSFCYKEKKTEAVGGVVNENRQEQQQNADKAKDIFYKKRHKV